MDQNPDRRRWSTTPKRLSAFVGALLNAGIPSTSVRALQLGFREHNFYPARDLPQFCVPEPPDVFFTYHSAQNYVDIQEIVWNAVGFAANLLRQARPDLDEDALEPMISDCVRLWVDFMFIDQAARDIRKELEILPELLHTARAHFVLGHTPLTRAWCCYEIALFNEGSEHLKGYIAPSPNFYLGWERTDVTEPEDKAFIQEAIESSFPGGFAGFDHVMAQANSVAVLPLTEGTVWSTPAADANLVEAAEAWFARAR